MIQLISGGTFVISLLVVLVLASLDRKKEHTNDEASVSFIIPCYNDGHLIQDTLQSIQNLTCQDKEIIVIDDASTDDSTEVIDSLQTKYEFTFLKNDENLGKAQTLNKASEHTSHNTVFFVDADVTANQAAFNDALARLQKPSVGGVSCPYKPRNNGFLATMQHIEYNMLSLVQGAYNTFSAIAMWGGFIGVDKAAFNETNKFSRNALTEDMDLAFKLNEHSWRVEQSFKPIDSTVPSTLQHWVNQKLRWNAGGFQCFIKHVGTWIKNPLHVFLIISYLIFMTGGVITTIQNAAFLNTFIDAFIALNNVATIETIIYLTALVYGFEVLQDILVAVGFTFLSTPYVLPLIDSIKHAHRIFLVIPYSMIYIPVFTLISIAAVAYYLQRAPSLLRGERAW